MQRSLREKLIRAIPAFRFHIVASFSTGWVRTESLTLQEFFHRLYCFLPFRSSRYLRA